ncbi:hypothetical protein HPE56_17335 [Maribacter sp. ANRC-HE7]|uniref:Fibronectin type-III domain-containing protein n=1 Tax=Maribacter aquimaris TaxID=2737171 RepID=A0ABR7V8U4_9FLAO|nr:hypothetical protein [Maribacter aquimaris]MBD0779568.1 hypothetical protein [Maribacter aquimaris]
MRVVILLFCFCGVLLLGCKKKSTPKSPEASVLVFPDKNSECTTGRDLNETTSQVEFKWMASEHTESYELRVTNLNSNITQTTITKSTSAKLPIAKGEPFSWLVRSKNTNVTETATSSTWNFYNAGSITTYAPFPAQLVNPQNGASLFKDINNEITLEWTAADLDDDIIGFDIYFSTEDPPEILEASLASTKREETVSVGSNITYYWKVVTKDAEGNSSDSGVFAFKVL